MIANTFNPSLFSICGVMNKHSVKVLWDCHFPFLWVRREIWCGSDHIFVLNLLNMLEGEKSTAWNWDASELRDMCGKVIFWQCDTGSPHLACLGPLPPQDLQCQHYLHVHDVLFT